MFKKILVRYDGSPEAKKALKLGLNLAKNTGSECHLVRVVKKPESVPDIEAFHNEVAKELAFIDKELIGARFIAGQEGLELLTHTVLGDSYEALKNFAQKGQFDLVVVTPKMESRLKDKLFSNYVENLLHDSKIAILVVRFETV